MSTTTVSPRCPASTGSGRRARRTVSVRDAATLLLRQAEPAGRAGAAVDEREVRDAAAGERRDDVRVLLHHVLHGGELPLQPGGLATLDAGPGPDPPAGQVDHGLVRLAIAAQDDQRRPIEGLAGRPPLDLVLGRLVQQDQGDAGVGVEPIRFPQDLQHRPVLLEGERVHGVRGLGVERGCHGQDGQQAKEDRDLTFKATRVRRHHVLL
jgi:hypothetical protein